MDTVLRRKPFCDDSDRVFDLVADGRIDGYVSILSLKDAFHLSKRMDPSKDPFQIIEDITYLFNTVDLNGADSLSALMSGVDYGVGLIAFSALRNGVRTVITRDHGRFSQTDMIAIDPKDVLLHMGGGVETGEVEIGGVPKKGR